MKPSQVHALDKLFSEVIRLRANGFCEYCGKFVKPEGINPSHYYGRVRQSTRWDEDNIQGLCTPCHMGFHDDRESYSAWVLKRLGEVRFLTLAWKAEHAQKMDYTILKNWLHSRIKELQ